MSLSPLEKKHIMDLLILSLEGQAGHEDMQQLRQTLDASSQARDYYLKAVTVTEHIRKLDWQAEFLGEPERREAFDNELWTALAEDEKLAPTVEISQEPSARELTENIVFSKIKPKVSKSNLLTIIVSTAALLLLLVHARISQDRTIVDVATLTDSMQTKWTDASSALKSGDRLYTNEVFSLSEGLVEIETDRGVRLTVEGPAEFQVLPNADVYLSHGRVYASVSQRGIGFTVATANTKVIDLGTEFGVKVEDDGMMELHVFKGKTTLVSGGSWLGKTAQTIIQNQARRISEDGTHLEEIPIQSNSFARVIQSETNHIWRGQPIDLADIVGGGNGLGSGNIQQGIHPLTGQTSGILYEDRLGNGQYAAVIENPYIDGVFVPDGDAQSVIVSSAGHTFIECPPTNNVFYMEIANSKIEDLAVPVLWKEMPAGLGIYGTDTCPSILMHANTGITFDLGAVRENYSGDDEMRFTAIAGLSPFATREGNVTVWVLVDGKVRYSQKHITEKGREYPVEILLKNTDRFLTLVSTDGSDIDSPEPSKRATDSDWALFVEPKLIFSDSSVD